MTAFREPEASVWHRGQSLPPKARGRSPGRRILGAGTAFLLWASVALPLPTAALAQDGPELRVALDNFWEENLDPIEMSSGGAEMISLMYDNLLRIEDGKVIPGIAESWEVAPDGLSWTFHLRDDVYFHDGTKMTAEDVAYSFERGASDEALDAEEWRSVLGQQPHIEVLDDRTVQVFTDGPKPFLPIRAAGTGSPAVWIVPKAYIEEHGEDYFAEHPIGTGIYKFVSRVRGDSMEFEAVDNHWSGVVPDFKRVETYFVPEEATALGMLQTGQVDAMRVGLEGAKQVAAEKDAGFTIVPGGSGVAYVAFLGTALPEAENSALHDVWVRHALSLAINRQEIIDTLLDGFGGLPPPHRLGLDNPDMPQHLREKWGAWAAESYVYDAAEAKRLVEEAGYGDGFSFEMWTAPDTSATYLSDLAVVLAHQWEAIGARPNITVVDAPALNARRHTKSSMEMVGQAMLTAADTYRVNTIEYLSHFTSDRGSWDLLVGTPEQGEVDALWDEGQSTLDPDRYAEILDRIITLGMEGWPSVPVVTSPVTFAFGPRVTASIPPEAQFLARSYADFKYTGVEP